MESHVEVKVIGKYNGHSVKANQSVDLSFKAGYDQLSGAVRLLQLLNNDVTIKSKVPDEKPFNLGTFRVQNVNISHDGEHPPFEIGIVDKFFFVAQSMVLNML